MSSKKSNDSPTSNTSAPKRKSLLKSLADIFARGNNRSRDHNDSLDMERTKGERSSELMKLWIPRAEHPLMKASVKPAGST